MQKLARMSVATIAPRLRLCVCALILCTPSAPVFADDPFDMETSNWMSFERYKEKPSNWVTPEQREQAAAEPVVVPPPVMPADLPKITAPTRPIAAPVMPGLNKDFDMRVSTTVDDHPMKDYVPPKADFTPGTEPNKESWKDAVQIARQSKDPTQKLGDEDTVPAMVRYTVLPPITTLTMRKATPVTVVAKKPETLPETAKAEMPVVVAPPPADPAACAAIEAYKKRQLAAIESDRKTLAALQAAIAELGLEKKLDFMTGASGSLQATGSVTLEAPVTKTP